MSVMKIELTTQMCSTLRQLVLPWLANSRDAYAPTIFEFIQDSKGKVKTVRVSSKSHWTERMIVYEIDREGNLIDEH